MYPAADVPVVQLSMPSLEPAALLDLGARLRTLREEGILVIGSGFMTHSFAVWRNPALAGHLDAFDEWATDAAEQGDVDTLVDYLAKAPAATIAHPTADHFVPLLLTMGAADDPTTTSTVFDRVVLGNHIRSLQAH
jgi:4,5-DOPA dioxygenase extradiol